MVDQRDVNMKEIHPNDLTWREQEVLSLLAERLTNREIAERLHLSEATIKAHVTAVMHKLGVTNRTQAVLAAGKLSVSSTGYSL